MISSEIFEHTQQGISGSHAIIYEGVGHLPNIECPERVVKDIKRFVM